MAAISRRRGDLVECTVPFAINQRAKKRPSRSLLCRGNLDSSIGIVGVGAIRRRRERSYRDARADGNAKLGPGRFVLL